MDRITKVKIVFFAFFSLAGFMPAQVTQQWAQQVFDGPYYGVHMVKDAGGNTYIGSGIAFGGVTDYLINKYRPNGNLAWSQTYAGVAGNYDVVEGIAIDDSAFIYVNGFSAEVGGIAYMTTIKYDSSGTMKWKRSSYIAESQFPMNGFEVAVDQDRNVYALGLRTTGYNPLKSTILLMKYNSNGDSLWGKEYTINSTLNSAGITYQGLKIDKQGNIYIAESIITARLPLYLNCSDQDLLILKYSPNGTLRWHVQYNWQTFQYGQYIYHIASDEYPTDTKLDENGNYYIAGYNRDSVQRSWGFIMKYDSIGTKKMEIHYNSSGSTCFYGIALNKSGDIFVTGCSDSSSFPSFPTTLYGSSMLTLKYDQAGNEKWVNKIDTDAYYNSQNVQGDITTDDCGNAYVAGGGNFNLKVVKYDSTGNQLWRKDSPTCSNYSEIITDNANAWVAGVFFEPIGQANIQVAKLHQTDSCTSPIINETAELPIIPNIFTPNGNGTNDVFTVTANGYKNYQLKIYNRWGSVIFESKDANVSWDGSLTPTLSNRVPPIASAVAQGEGGSAPDGTYYYTLQLTDKKEDVSKYKGFLTLIK